MKFSFKKIVLFLIIAITAFTIWGCISVDNVSKKGQQFNSIFSDENTPASFNFFHHQTINIKQDDSVLFGKSIVMSDSRIYVGDSGKNRIVVFSKDSSDKWFRDFEIDAPAGVLGFGYDLALNDNYLIIGAYSMREKEIGFVYKYNKKEGLKQIAKTDSDHIVGFAVAADKNLIAYSRRKANDFEYQAGSVILLDGNNSIEYSSEKYPGYFGMDIILNKYELLITAPGHDADGGVFLFDIRNNSNKPDEIIKSKSGRITTETKIINTKNWVVLSGAGNALGTESLVIDRVSGKQHIVFGSGEMSSNGLHIIFNGLSPTRFFHSEIDSPACLTIYDMSNSKGDLNASEFCIDNRILRLATSMNRDSMALVARPEDNKINFTIFKLNIGD